MATEIPGLTITVGQPDEDAKTCKGCRFWRSKAPVGECRRGAPTLQDFDQEFGRWPLTHPGEWCGEFKPKATRCYVMLAMKDQPPSPWHDAALKGFLLFFGGLVLLLVAAMVPWW